MYQFFHRPTPVIIMIFIFHLGHLLLEAVSELLAQLLDPALVARRHHTPRLTLMFRMRMLMRKRMLTRMRMLMRMRMILMIFTLAACCSEMSPTGFDAFRSRSKSALLSVDIYHFQHHHHIMYMYNQYYYHMISISIEFRFQS